MHRSIHREPAGGDAGNNHHPPTPPGFVLLDTLASETSVDVYIARFRIARVGDNEDHMPIECKAHIDLRSVTMKGTWSHASVETNDTDFIALDNQLFEIAGDPGTAKQRSCWPLDPLGPGRFDLDGMMHRRNRVHEVKVQLILAEGGGVRGTTVIDGVEWTITSGESNDDSITWSTQLGVEFTATADGAELTGAWFSSCRQR